MIKSISFKRLLLAGLFVFCASFDAQAIAFNFGGHVYNLHVTAAGAVRYGNNHPTHNPALDAAFLAHLAAPVPPAAPPLVAPAPQHRFRNIVRRLLISAAATGTICWLVPTLLNSRIIANMPEITQNSAELMSELTFKPFSAKAIALITGLATTAWHLIRR